MKPGRLNAGLHHLSQIETGEEPSNLEEGLPDAQLFMMRIVDSHFSYIIHFLTTGRAPEGYMSQKKKELVVHAVDFSEIARNLYKMGANKILRRYVPDFEQNSILVKAHGGVAGVNYAGNMTSQKILHKGLWWPMLHKDCKAYCRVCDACQ